jgi:hypothetical protein
MRDRFRGGSPLAGFSVGALTLATKHALIPGNPQHASTFPFPVVYGIVDVADPLALMRGDTWVGDHVVQAAHRLVSIGVRCVTGICGSFAHFQQRVADELSVPAYLSVLTQIPLILTGLRRDRRLLVLCSARSAVSPSALAQCGVIETTRLTFEQMLGCPEFDRMLAQEIELDAARLRDETLTQVAKALTGQRDIGAVLLQCSDLAPFAGDITRECGLPVFDVTHLITWAHRAVMPAPHRSVSSFMIQAD